MEKNSSYKHWIEPTELAKRFEILVDHLFSYSKHLNGRKWHSRLADHILYPNWIVVGQTSEKKCNYHREHIVPCVLLFSECFRIISELDPSIARSECLLLLKRYLKVVIISKDKATELDSKLIGLKTTMPDKWKFGDDPFARIKIVYPDLGGICLFNGGDLLLPQAELRKTA